MRIRLLSCLKAKIKKASASSKRQRLSLCGTTLFAARQIAERDHSTRSFNADHAEHLTRGPISSLFRRSARGGLSRFLSSTVSHQPTALSLDSRRYFSGHRLLQYSKCYSYYKTAFGKCQHLFAFYCVKFLSQEYSPVFAAILHRNPSRKEDALWLCHCCVH